MLGLTKDLVVRLIVALEKIAGALENLVEEFCGDPDDDGTRH